MAADPSRQTSRRPVDPAAVSRVARRLDTAAAVSAPWLHGEVARRMAERLPVVRLRPQRVLDWGAQLGGSDSALRAIYPDADIVAVETHASVPPPPMPPSPWWRWRQRTLPHPVCLSQDSVPPQHGQLLWSNMRLHHVLDPQAQLRQWQQAVAVDGFLMFSTLGPGSLPQLRSLYRARGWPVPHAPFVDMHDLGDMLVQAGFADPVMDQEVITLTWPDAPALLSELRSLGGNADPQRFAGLRTPRWHAGLLQAIAAQADSQGRIALDFEVVYGHAFRPAPRPRLTARTEVPLQDLRDMVRSGRGKP